MSTSDERHEDGGRQRCPACFDGATGDLCAACKKDGYAKCPSCDEYHHGLKVYRYACGCDDDEAVCVACGASTGEDDCQRHQRREPIPFVDFDPYEAQR